MRVIQEGRQHPQWVGKEVSCHECGGKYELEPSDTPAVKVEDDQRDGRFLSVVCPNCTRLMTCNF